MLFQPVKTPGIAHNAYILGSGGAAAVIDPRRDVEQYLDIARRNGLSIRYIVETHRQEDFVLGSVSLRRLTGAEIVAGDHPLSEHADVRLKDGEEITVGEVRLRGLATPGHTPESMSYAAFVPDCPDRAWGVFTGDALFIGETGRTDLPDPDKTGENAGLLYDAIHARILPLGDQTLLFPAHGAGSVCGGHIANRDHSSLGLERSSNPVFTMSRDAFVRRKLEERIPRPPYFSRIEKLNTRGGADWSAEALEPRVLQPDTFAKECATGLVIDTRLPEAFAGGHLPNSYSVWLGGLPVFGGWVADAQTPIYLVLDDPDDLHDAVLSLGRIGVEPIAGVLASGFEAWRNAGMPVESTGTITPRDLADRRPEFTVLDVREISEYEAGHIGGARHLYVGDLIRQPLDLGREIQPDSPVVVTCSVGHRASLAVSALKRRGLRHVFNLLGGMTAWAKLGLPQQKGPAPDRRAA